MVVGDTVEGWDVMEPEGLCVGVCVSFFIKEEARLIYM